MSSKLQLDGRYHQSILALSGEHWCNLQVKLCYACMSALEVSQLGAI